MTLRRLDEELVARGLAASRSRARDLILRGLVKVNAAPARKPSQGVAAESTVVLAPTADHYVSRAAVKLVHALDHFAVDVEGRHCLDLGASTGGFTQVLLERGAAHVTAIDVGHAQMARQIASDPRVTLHEGVNARNLSRVHMPEDVSVIVCDVSFISLRLALPPALAMARTGTVLVALIKPQFEVGRENIGSGGIVRDPALIASTCDAIAAFLDQLAWRVMGVTLSPITGGDGNHEFLIGAVKA